MAEIVSPGQDRGPRGPRVLAKGFFYAQTPMLLLDARERVCEINAALKVLMGMDVAGCRGQDYEILLGRLRPRLDGELFPAGGIVRTRTPAAESARARPMFEDARIAEGRCRYRSPDFGLADLATAEVPGIDTTTGELVGSVLNVELLSLEEEPAYREAVQRRWAHEIMWEIYASSYDAIIPEMPFYKEVLDRHLAAMRGADVVRVLDVGAGTGTVTVPLLKAGKSVTAVDVSRAMLEKLSSKLDDSMNNLLDIIEDTAECLPRLADESFDGVTALNSFFDMEDPHAALREAVRVLRPGGTIVITDPRECFDADALKAIAERYLIKLGLYERLHDDWLRVQSVTPALEERIVSNRAAEEGPSPRPAWHAEAIYETLRKLGFMNLSFEEAHEGHCATIQGRKPL